MSVVIIKDVTQHYAYFLFLETINRPRSLLSFFPLNTPKKVDWAHEPAELIRDHDEGYGPHCPGS